MDRQKTVAGLDVHKDSIYLCVMGHDEAIIFQKRMEPLLQTCVRCAPIWFPMV